jgi:hypothetical protein
MVHSGFSARMSALCYALVILRSVLCACCRCAGLSIPAAVGVLYFLCPLVGTELHFLFLLAVAALRTSILFAGLELYLS